LFGSPKENCRGRVDELYPLATEAISVKIGESSLRQIVTGACTVENGILVKKCTCGRLSYGSFCDITQCFEWE
jgi:hypothetical protein